MNLNLITVRVGPSLRPSVHHLAKHFHVTMIIMHGDQDPSDLNPIFLQLFSFCFVLFFFSVELILRLFPRFKVKSSAGLSPLTKVFETSCLRARGHALLHQCL